MTAISIGNENQIRQKCINLILKVHLDVAKLSEILQEEAVNNVTICYDLIRSINKNLEEIKILKTRLWKMMISRNQYQHPESLNDNIERYRMVLARLQDQILSRSPDNNMESMLREFPHFLSEQNHL